MILPLSTALAVSQSKVDDISGESFVSIKNVHSLLKKVLKSGSSNKEVLKRHLGEGGVGWLIFSIRETGAWSLIIIG